MRYIRIPALSLLHVLPSSSGAGCAMSRLSCSTGFCKDRSGLSGYMPDRRYRRRKNGSARHPCRMAKARPYSRIRSRRTVRCTKGSLRPLQNRCQGYSTTSSILCRMRMTDGHRGLSQHLSLPGSDMFPENLPSMPSRVRVLSSVAESRMQGYSGPPCN